MNKKTRTLVVYILVLLLSMRASTLTLNDLRAVNQEVTFSNTPWLSIFFISMSVLSIIYSVNKIFKTIK